MSIKKIVVIGPESTGKSTLSSMLAEALHTAWVPEYARTYLTRICRPYIDSDLLEIAQGQIAAEEQTITDANEYLICDTDLYVLKVWSEHSYGRCHPYILEQIAIREYDLYLLTDIDIAWEDDPFREHPGAMREYFYKQYHDIVQQAGVPWAAISGSLDERLDKALAAIKNRM